MDDKRKYPRLNWSVIIHWEKSSGETDEVPNTGSTKDISAGGIRLILKEGVEIGDVLELDLELGGGRNIHVKGRVAWIEKFKISGWQEETGYEGGVEFLDLDDATRQELARFTMQSRTGRS